jgi:hypothetical protein
MIRGQVEYRLRGFGKTPALYVAFLPKLALERFDPGRPPRPPFLPFNVRQESRANCDAGARGNRAMMEQPDGFAWGQIIFPEEMTDSANARVTTDQDEFYIRGIEDRERVIIHFYACVAYSTSLDSNPHETAVNYMITDSRTGSFVINIEDLPLNHTQWRLITDTVNAGFIN